MNYINASWKGDTPLSKAFILNFFVIHIIVTALLAMLIGPFLINIHVPQITVIIILITTGGAQYIWAFVGVWRSSNKTKNLYFKFGSRVLMISYSIFIVIINLNEL